MSMLHTGLVFVTLAHLPSPAPFTILYSGNFFAQRNFSVPCCPAPMPAGAALQALHWCTQSSPSPPQMLLLSDLWAIIHPLIHEKRTL